MIVSVRECRDPARKILYIKMPGIKTTGSGKIVIVISNRVLVQVQLANGNMPGYCSTGGADGAKIVSFYFYWICELNKGAV